MRCLALGCLGPDRAGGAGEGGEEFEGGGEIGHNSQIIVYLYGVETRLR